MLDHPTYPRAGAITAPAEGSVLAGHSAPPVLELIAVSKRYAAVRALDDVSLAVNAGEVLGLLGENGAGKSTLIKIAAGIVRADSGEIRVNGSPTVLGSPADAHLAGIRVAPQELALCNELSVAENICMGELPSRAFGIVDRATMYERAAARLKTIGADRIDVRTIVGRLRVVDQTLVQFARALAPGARVLIADEPTAPMSEGEVGRILEVIREVTRTGIGIIYVSHRLDEVFRIVGRAAVLRDGRKVAELDAEHLTRAGIVNAMVGGRDLESHRGSHRQSSDVVMTIKDLAAGRLRKFNAQIHAGEIVAAYGIAGSGRDELGGAIIGSVPRIHGELRVGDQLIPPNNIRASIRAGVGYVPAERRTQGLILPLSVRQNTTLAILRRLRRGAVLRRGEERRTAEHWRTALQIATPTVEAAVWTLSGGSQQKVLLARWLAARSRILVLEEPTRGVDIATKAEIYRILGGLADEGSAILVISSDLDEIVTVADRVLIVRDGLSTEELRDATQEQIAVSALKTSIAESAS